MPEPNPRTAALTAIDPMRPNSFQTKRAAMLSGPIGRTLFQLTFPVIMVIAAQTFVAVLEAFWVSRLGTAAVAGVSLVLPLQILMNTMSNGGIGGGVSSAVSRAWGSGQTAEANELVFHSVIIALGFGLFFAVGALVLGPAIYTSLGGSGDALLQATIYFAWVFIGSPVIWIVNLFGSAMRGVGDVKISAIVSFVGAAVLVPLSPALIFGVGPLPRMGVGGAGAATLLFYGFALVIYVVRLRRGAGGLHLRIARLQTKRFAAILGVGSISAFGTMVASLTVVAITGAVGRMGAVPLAGYGIASRIDSLLVPLLFGLGSGVVTLVGFATGAHDDARARRVTVFSAALAFVFTEFIGVVLAIEPDLWMGRFTTDYGVAAVGGSYLHIVAPFYGFFGVGLMLYFASQGRSNMLWPFIAGSIRFGVVVIGAVMITLRGGSINTLFAGVSAGSVLFGIINWWGIVRGFRQGVSTLDLPGDRHQSP